MRAERIVAGGRGRADARVCAEDRRVRAPPRIGRAHQNVAYSAIRIAITPTAPALNAPVVR